MFCHKRVLIDHYESSLVCDNTQQTLTLDWQLKSTVTTIYHFHEFYISSIFITYLFILNRKLIYVIQKVIDIWQFFNKRCFWYVHIYFCSIEIKFDTWKHKWFRQALILQMFFLWEVFDVLFCVGGKYYLMVPIP